jgi:hypothetical protein
MFRILSLLFLFIIKISVMEAQTYREPAVAGSFYPADSYSLGKEVQTYLSKAKARKGDAIAVVSPHAGYVFSGQIAADAINQINPDKEYKDIFIIGISHHKNFEGASVYNIGNYYIPGAEIEVDTELADNLIAKSKYIFFDKEADAVEHSVEVQIPFLYYHLKKKFKIVPIIIGTQNEHILRDIAEVLKPYFNENNVFIFSSDFSHYPSYREAKQVDKRTAEALLSNDKEKFLEAIEQNRRQNIPNLLTSACGASALLVLLDLTKPKEEYTYKIIEYKNSGDSERGVKIEVVGYYAIAVYKKKDTFKLSKKEKEELLKISRKTLESYVRRGKIEQFDDIELTDNLKAKVGAFVTLTEGGRLRGCIGRFMPQEPLWKVVRDMTIAACSEDTRFSPVSSDELSKIEIEISVLTPLQKIKSPEQIKIGRDGIYIKKGFYSGTLLPQVAIENKWDRQEFLEYCSKYKAGIGKDGWKEAELYIYQAIVFREEK